MSTMYDEIKREVAAELKEWIGSEDFKQCLEKEIGMPYDEIIAKLRDKLCPMRNSPFNPVDHDTRN